MPKNKSTDKLSDKSEGVHHVQTLLATKKPGQSEQQSSNYNSSKESSLRSQKPAQKMVTRP